MQTFGEPAAHKDMETLLPWPTLPRAVSQNLAAEVNLHLPGTSLLSALHLSIYPIHFYGPQSDIMPILTACRPSRMKLS